MKRLKKLFIIASLFFASNSYSYFYSYFAPAPAPAPAPDYYVETVVIITNSATANGISASSVLASLGVLAYIAPEIPGAILSTVTGGIRSAANRLRKITGCESRRHLRR